LRPFDRNITIYVSKILLLQEITKKATMNYSIEPASEHHASELAAIMNYYIQNTTVSFFTESLSSAEMCTRLFFREEYYQAFVISEAGSVIGYCAVSQWKKQEAYRHTGEINIYLHPEFTGKGIGPALLAYAESFAKEHDIRTLIAGLCSENMPSRKLFERTGYQLCANFERVGYKFGRELGVIYLQKFIS
jgi:phosphinothricin acetyltransferase